MRTVAALVAIAVTTCLVAGAGCKKPDVPPTSEPVISKGFDGADFVRRLQESVAAGPDADGKGYELARQAVEAARALDTYSARFEKQEYVGAELRPVEQIDVWIREDPLAVRMRWVGRVDPGKDVLYVEGENDDRLRVYAGHMVLKMRVNLDPFSDAAMKDNRHAITRMGLATLASGLLLNQGESVPADEKSFRLLGGATLDERPVDVVGRPVASDDPETPADLLIYCLDAATHLPVLAARYDDAGNLLEMYHYSNVAPTDAPPQWVFDFDSLGKAP
ncbi:MAG: DUF1571 domain-containing protein [Planctomycetes bacterium]|nr:DUF1571 domain-containing protein [Planctomycetota bacterium]